MLIKKILISSDFFFFSINRLIYPSHDRGVREISIHSFQPGAAQLAYEVICEINLIRYSIERRNVTCDRDKSSNNDEGFTF